MGFSNLLSSALTAVATLSGDPDIQRTANSANDLVVSYQTQQQQAMAERILNSPDGIIPVTEKGVTVWRTLQYDGNGDVVGFSDFNSKEEYLLLKQQELKAQQLRQQQLQAEQAQRRFGGRSEMRRDRGCGAVGAWIRYDARQRAAPRASVVASRRGSHIDADRWRVA